MNIFIMPYFLKNYAEIYLFYNNKQYVGEIDTFPERVEILSKYRHVVCREIL